MSSSTDKTPMTIPHQTMQCHTDRVTGVVHLPSGQHIITCSMDGSLRLWDLESGTQIGEDWKNHVGVWSMALSPNGKTVASGSGSGDTTVRLWDIEKTKVIAKWTGHTDVVCTLCWSADGKRLMSGSWDGMARVWDVESGKPLLQIKTGHEWVYMAMFSPDDKNIATCGDNESAVKIWDAMTGELITTLEHDDIVYSLVWTSDGKQLIFGSYGPIRIFDTATWKQIAVLEGHTSRVHAISLSPNDRLLASASVDKTARLWNLDTNLPFGPPLQHEDHLRSAALSADGKVLVTGCNNGNVYTWDIQAIIKEAGLKDPLSDKSVLEADATRCHDEFGGYVDELPPRFFHGIRVRSSATGDAHSLSPASALLARLSSLLHRFQHDHAEPTDLPQPTTPSRFHPHVLLPRLFSLVHRSPHENDAANELQRPSMPSGSDLHTLLARLSSLLPRYRLNTNEETEPHPTTPSSLRPDALIDLLSSLFRSQPHTNEEIELPRRPCRPHVVEVAPMRDREVLFVAQRLPPDRPHTQPNGNSIPGEKRPHSLPLRMLAHLVLFLCCASPQHDGNAQQTPQQQEGQSQTQAPSLHTQPATPSMSTTPIALDTHTTAAGAALPWRARFVLFLCCASPPHADGH